MLNACKVVEWPDKRQQCLSCAEEYLMCQVFKADIALKFVAMDWYIYSSSKCQNVEYPYHVHVRLCLDAVRHVS